MISPDFLNANEWTPYPFNAEYTDVTRAFIDAMVSVPGAYQGQDVRITYILAQDDTPRRVKVESGGDVLIEDTQPVVVSAFGDYEVWDAVGSDGRSSVQLVYRTAAADFIYSDSTGLTFVDNTVSYAPQNLVESVLVGAEEAAGPGQNLVLADGSHISLTISTDADGTTRVLIDAQYRADGPCVPVSLDRSVPIQSINGIGPDEFGGFKLRGDGVWLVDASSAGLNLRNVGQACCDCGDYVEVFNDAKTTHNRLNQVRKWILSAQERYSALLRYTKFLLRSPIVGDPDPGTGDGPGEAECEPD